MATDAHPIKPSDVRTREEIKPVLGGSLYGGIVPSDEKADVLLFSDAEAGAEYGYDDGWLLEEDELGPVFEYTGAGRSDQVFDGPLVRKTLPSSATPTRGARCISSSRWARCPAERPSDTATSGSSSSTQPNCT